MKFKNGRFSGKGQTAIGKMTAYMLGGANVFRSVPEHVKQTETPEYLARKKRFGTLSYLIKALSGVFSMGTFPLKEAQNFRNPASTANSPAVTCAINASPVIDYHALVLSKGSLTGQPVTAAYHSNSNVIEVSWTPNTSYGANANDTIYVCAFSETDELLMALEDDARSSGTISVPTTGFTSGSSVSVYVFAKSTNGNFWSDSQFIDSFTMS